MFGVRTDFFGILPKDRHMAHLASWANLFLPIKMDVSVFQDQRISKYTREGGSCPIAEYVYHTGMGCTKGGVA